MSTDPDALLISIDDDITTAREALKRALGKLVQLGASNPGSKYLPIGCARAELGDALGDVHTAQLILEPDIELARRPR